jgi:hypothetical protein
MEAQRYKREEDRIRRLEEAEVSNFVDIILQLRHYMLLSKLRKCGKTITAFEHINSF